MLRTSYLMVTVAFVSTSVGCASQPPAQIAQAQSDDRQDMTESQREERAALERKQSNERVTLGADQDRQNLDSASRGDQREDSVHREQAKFGIDMREQLARIDARIVELKRVGKTVDAATLQARDALATHIGVCDDQSMEKASWLKHRDMLNSEMTALNNQVDRVEG